MYQLKKRNKEKKLFWEKIREETTETSDVLFEEKFSFWKCNYILLSTSSEPDMKYATPELLQNAFLKVFVAGSPHRLYFRDVKSYKKIPKRISPALPAFAKENHRRRLSK